MLTNDRAIPLYVKLRDLLMSRIQEGDLKVNQKIPSERELSENYNVSRTSIRKAILSLTQEGVLVRIPGKGTFVSSHFDANNI